MLAKPAAFFLRDLRTAVSYRITFVSTLAALGFSLVTLEFTSRLVEEGAPSSLAPFGNDYFTFALIGTSIALFGQAVSKTFPDTVRGAQVTGTLEVLLGTRTTLPSFLVCSSLYAVGFAVVQLLAALVIAEVALGANLRLDEALTVVLILLLTTAVFAALGIFSAAFVIRFKQRDPITGLILTASFLVSGVIYPTAVLPDWLEPLAPLLPLTHVASALRDTLMADGTRASATNEVLALAGFALLLPISLLVFNYAVQRAKVVGSLSQY
jgi:ABC-2 type transport system permease protein